MWEALARNAAVPRGEKGERLKRDWEKGVRLYQAASDKGQWFCRESTVSLPNGKVFRPRDVFSSAAGFLVTEFMSTRAPTDRPQEACIEQHIRWKYRDMGGIFVPAHVLDINRVGVRGEGQGTVRWYTLLSCEINPPVDAAEFDWAGLGMAEGTVVVDKVEGMAYIWEGGETHQVRAPGGSCRARGSASVAAMKFGAGDAVRGGGHLSLALASPAGALLRG